MKLLHIINYYLQWFWILAAVLIILISVANGYDNLWNFVYFFTYMGLNHVLYSLIEFLAYAKFAKLKRHLTMSVFAVINFIACVTVCIEWTLLEVDIVILYGIAAFGILPCIALAIYFIHRVFDHYDPIFLQEHSYLDLE